MSRIYLDPVAMDATAGTLREHTRGLDTSVHDIAVTARSYDLGVLLDPAVVVGACPWDTAVAFVDPHRPGEHEVRP